MIETANNISAQVHSVAQVSQITTLSIPYLRQKIRSGELKAKKIGRRVLILNSALSEFLNSQEDWSSNKLEEVKGE